MDELRRRHRFGPHRHTDQITRQRPSGFDRGDSMNMQRNNRGLTLIGFLVVLCVAGFFAYLVMKLLPIYVEYFGVVKAMEMVKNEPGSAQKSLEEIRRDIILKFNTQYVDET